MDVKIDFTKIKAWSDFHNVFNDVMGFPDFYGRNMNAWIDCMSYINDVDSGMSCVVVEKDECLDIIVSGIEEAETICPDILLGFLTCAAFVNQRFINDGSKTRLRITP